MLPKRNGLGKARACYRTRLAIGTGDERSWQCMQHQTCRQAGYDARPHPNTPFNEGNVLYRLILSTAATRHTYGRLDGTATLGGRRAGRPARDEGEL
jgi:hypothetical protein